MILIDPRPYMTYQPFLPEVLAGSIEPRHALISLRKNLPRTRVISGSVIEISHADKAVVVRPYAGDDYALAYDIVVVTAGAVTRMFPVAGLKQGAIGLKHVEEAIAIRNQLLAAFDRAAGLPPGAERRRLLTATVVGGGFTGVEGFGELLSLAECLLRYYPELKREDLDFRLVQAADRILPEVSARISAYVTKSLQRRGAHVHLNTQVVSAVNGRVVLSTGEQFETNVIVWAAGNGPSPIIAKHTDLPVDSRGFLIVRSDLRVGTKDHLIRDAWGAGDDASVPDLSGDSPTGRTVANAQNAVRQGRLLAANIVASLRGKPLTQYFHRNLGTIATLGIGRGAFQSGRIGFTGFFAWGSIAPIISTRFQHGIEKCVCWPVGASAHCSAVTLSQLKMNSIRERLLYKPEFLNVAQRSCVRRVSRTKWRTLHESQLKTETQPASNRLEDLFRAQVEGMRVPDAMVLALSSEFIASLGAPAFVLVIPLPIPPPLL